MLIVSIIYGNPDYYPPMINAAVILDRYQSQQIILSTDFVPSIWVQGPIQYPSTTTIRRLSSTGGAGLKNYIKFNIKVLRCGIHSDVIIAYNMHALLPARLLAWFNKIPLVYHSHDYVENNAPQSLSSRIVKLFERTIARTADLVIVPDEKRAQVMKRELHLKQDPTIVANSSLSNELEPTPELELELRKLGKRFEKIVFRPGRIGPGHCIDTTLRSIPLWSSKNWGFVIMGYFEAADRQAYEQLAASLGVSSQFVILPAVSYPEVLRYTKGADLGHGIYEPTHVNNRYITTASNKIMEYIASGLPLIVNNSEGNQALITKYKNGLAVQHDSPEAIADAINLILGTPALAKQMAEGSQRAFSEEFNYSKQYAPVLEKLEAIILEKRHHPRYSRDKPV